MMIHVASACFHMPCGVGGVLAWSSVTLSDRLTSLVRGLDRTATFGKLLDVSFSFGCPVFLDGCWASRISVPDSDAFRLFWALRNSLSQLMRNVRRASTQKSISHRMLQDLTQRLPSATLLCSLISASNVERKHLMFARPPEHEKNSCSPPNLETHFEGRSVADSFSSSLVPPRSCNSKVQ